MPNWFVSAHGTYESTGTHLLLLDNKEVVYFVNDESILLNKHAWPYFTLLMQGKEDTVYNNGHARKETKQTYNYVATGTNDFPSGIFEVGSKKPILLLKNGERLTLGQILGSSSCPARVYWLCCREYAPVTNVGLTEFKEMKL